MKAELIQSSDPRWNEALTQCRHDLYHLPKYVEFAAKYEGGTAVAFYAESNEAVFLIPLILRSLPEELGAPSSWCDAAMIRGYPTPIISDSGNPELLSSFLEAFIRTGREHNVISAFFRLHPLMPLSIDVLKAYGSLVFHGSMVYFDLSIPEDEIWAGVCANHKKGLRKLAGAGFTARMDNSYYEQFISLYRETMKRVNAADIYCYSDEYFKDFMKELGDHLRVFVVLSPDGDIAAAGLVSVADRIMQGIGAAYNNDFKKNAPTKMLYDYEWRWAKDNGFHYNFKGGGPGGKEGSVMQFKLGFTKLLADFYTYRMIIDNDKYVQLEQSHRKNITGAVGSENFFPAYRV